MSAIGAKGQAALKKALMTEARKEAQNLRDSIQKLTKERGTLEFPDIYYCELERYDGPSTDLEQAEIPQISTPDL